MARIHTKNDQVRECEMSLALEVSLLFGLFSPLTFHPFTRPVAARRREEHGTLADQGREKRMPRGGDGCVCGYVATYSSCNAFPLSSKPSCSTWLSTPPTYIPSHHGRTPVSVNCSPVALQGEIEGLKKLLLEQRTKVVRWWVG